MVQALAAHQIARGSTLITVNLQMAGSVGTALMSVILTNEFNRSENISAATKIAILRQNAARLGVPVDPAALPRRALAPDFASEVLHDLSRAYFVVFVVAVFLVALTCIPAAFLPRKRRPGRARHDERRLTAARASVRMRPISASAHSDN